LSNPKRILGRGDDVVAAVIKEMRDGGGTNVKIFKC